MKKTIFLSAILAIALIACKPQQPVTETTPADALCSRLSKISQKGYMFGHQDDPFYGLTWEYEDGRSDTKELVGDYPAVMGFDIGGIEMGDLKNLDSVPFNLMREEIIAHHERGGIITISWHLRNPLNGKTAWIDEDLKEYEQALADGKSADELIDPKHTVAATLEGGEVHEKFIGWLDKVTEFIGSLKTSDGEVVPVIFRPWHENTGNWFWWGEANCSAEEYKALWNMTQDYMDERLEGQLVWSYSPGPRSLEHFLERWPGDDRVQLVGTDAYQYGSDEAYMAQLDRLLTMMCDSAKERNILVAVTECGKTNSVIPDWWTRIFDASVKDFPICYCLPWRNYPKEHFGPSKETPTAEDFKKFYELPNTLFLNDIKNIK